MSETQCKPILMSAPMVRALLDGTKSQTRRVVKIKMPNAEIASMHATADGSSWIAWSPNPVSSAETAKRYANGGVLCPYGKPGDQLFVKETYVAYGRWERAFDEKKGRLAWYFVDRTRVEGHVYRFDSTTEPWRGPESVDGWYRRPSLFMPRAASRITLEITEVRVQRLQEISINDAIAEGALECTHLPYVGGMPCEQARIAFEALWESINDAGSWEVNPWVWAVSFKVVKEAQ